MAQTSKGAKKAVETTRQRYGKDFFKLRASKGGKAPKNSNGRFKKGSDEAREAGLKGAAKRHKL